ncbi:MAG: response regulator [Verrucomicrobia bacterium]|nr:response regulator [Verrucomicrobiota bacterium]
MARILVVDDDGSVCGIIRDVLKDAGHAVDTAQDELEAADRIRGNAYEAVIADMVMRSPEGGLQVLRAAKEKDPLTQVIVLTAYGSVANAVEALKGGAFTYLEKRGTGTAETVVLRQKLGRALEYRAALLSADELSGAIDEAARVLAGVVSQIEEVSALLATAARARQQIPKSNGSGLLG